MSNSKKNTTFSIAFCGILVALSLIFLFSTGIFPFATYSLPCLAGLLTGVIVVECGYQWAWCSYTAVSILAFFLTPDREATVMFLVFFGYFPIVKGKFEKLSFRPLEYFFKFLLFNIAMISSYYAMIHLFGMPELLEEMSELGKYGAWILLGAGNLVFLLYDFAATQLLTAYLYRIRPRIHRILPK